MILIFNHILTLFFTLNKALSLTLKTDRIYRPWFLNVIFTQKSDPIFDSKYNPYFWSQMWPTMNPYLECPLNLFFLKAQFCSTIPETCSSRFSFSCSCYLKLGFETLNGSEITEYKQSGVIFIRQQTFEEFKWQTNLTESTSTLQRKWVTFEKYLKRFFACNVVHQLTTNN